MGGPGRPRSLGAHGRARRRRDRGLRSRLGGGFRGARRCTAGCREARGRARPRSAAVRRAARGASRAALARARAWATAQRLRGECHDPREHAARCCASVSPRCRGRCVVGERLREAAARGRRSRRHRRDPGTRSPGMRPHCAPRRSGSRMRWRRATARRTSSRRSSLSLPPSRSPRASGRGRPHARRPAQHASPPHVRDGSTGSSMLGSSRCRRTSSLASSGPSPPRAGGGQRGGAASSSSPWAASSRCSRSVCSGRPRARRRERPDLHGADPSSSPQPTPEPSSSTLSIEDEAAALLAAYAGCAGGCREVAEIRSGSQRERSPRGSPGYRSWRTSGMSPSSVPRMPARPCWSSLRGTENGGGSATSTPRTRHRDAQSVPFTRRAAP